MGGSTAQLASARSIANCVVGVALLLTAGCSSVALIPWGDGFRHAEHGFAIAGPPKRDPAWHRIDVKGADLAYQRQGDELMSMRASCGQPTAQAKILARHLRIGLGRHVVRDEGVVVHRGLEGWRQTFDIGAEGGAVRVASVTLVDGPCTIDFLFSARDSFDRVFADFDAWWQGYEPANAVSAEGAE